MIKEKIVDEMRYFYCDETDEWFPQYKDENNLTKTMMFMGIIFENLISNTEYCYRDTCIK